MKLNKYLEFEEFAEYFKKYKDGDIEALNYLIESYRPLVSSLIAKLNILDSYLEDELMVAGLEAIWESLEKYDLANKSYFTTYVTMAIKRKIKLVLSEKRLTNNQVSLTTIKERENSNKLLNEIKYLEDVEDTYIKEETINKISDLIRQLPAKYQNIILTYFEINNKFKTLKQLAEDYGVTQSTIVNYKNKSINTIRLKLNKLGLLDELELSNPKSVVALKDDDQAIYNLFTQRSTHQQLDQQLVDVIIYFLNTHKLERLKYYFGENLENFSDENSDSVEVNNIKHNILKEFHCQNLYDTNSDKLIVHYLNSKVRYIYNYFRDLNTGRILNPKIVDKIIRENNNLRKLLFANGLALNLKNVIIKDVDMWHNLRAIVQRIITNLTNELNTDIFALSYEEFLELYQNSKHLLLKK